ncbi:MAG TPA: DUF1501 domain-containing protein [Blastocatellia bacterium]|nr:DUF1501 domain-containing protein [Blastocatellia bacterium]
MPTTRRQFIKRSAAMVSVGVVMPKLWIREARSQTAAANRRILVIIQLAGGNDGLNTVVPYTDSRYYSQRPTLSFRDSELKDKNGHSTIISNEFGLHPALSEIRDLYLSGRVAVTLGAGYPNPNLSHFLSMDIWHTASLTGLGSEGWLGKYADVALVGKAGLPASSVGGVLPKSLYSNEVVIPSILNFALYDFVTDFNYPGDSNNQLNTFQRTAGRSLPTDSYNGAINSIGLEAVRGALQVKSSVANYSSSVTYAPDNPLAQGMKMLAQIITTIPEASLLYVTLGGFDHHSDQISHPNNRADKFSGQHAGLLRWFSDAVKTFYDDMAQHGLGDNVLMMQWSEFGRRPNENDSFGTDHGTAAPLFVIGNSVRGGLYGQQPSLATTNLDSAGNMKFTVDFRSVYATVLDGWLGVDSKTVLGGSFENVGFVA